MKLYQHFFRKREERSWFVFLCCIYVQRIHTYTYTDRTCTHNKTRLFWELCWGTKASREWVRVWKWEDGYVSWRLFTTTSQLCQQNIKIYIYINIHIGRVVEEGEGGGSVRPSGGNKIIISPLLRLLFFFTKTAGTCTFFPLKRTPFLYVACF